MTEGELAELAERFEAHRVLLRSVAYRLLGSVVDAEDAVQEAWFRISRVEPDAIENLGGWLRTVVTRICLDKLRSSPSRRERADGGALLEVPGAAGAEEDPEEQALRAESASRALVVVLDRLKPDERVAFVLHDVFAVNFAEIAPIVERTPAATKKLASRARRKVRGTPAATPRQIVEQRRVIGAFLAAARAGDIDAIVAVLAPDVVRRVEPTAAGGSAELRGARAVAEGTVALSGRARFAELIMIDGAIGAIVAPGGRLLIALRFVVEGGRITSYSVIADADSLERMDLAVLDDVTTT